MIKKIVFLFVIFISNTLVSQSTNFDAYKYIVVANKFDFLKEADQYQTSSLTKFLLKKKGFEVFLSDEKLPEDLTQNRCLSLFASVKDESGMLSIKNLIEIKDCFDRVVYTSKIGKSKIKDYKKGYQDAIREAYETMEDFEYTYNANVKLDANKLQKEEIISKNISDKVVINAVETPKVISKSEDEIISTKNDTLTKNNINTLYAQSIENGFQLVNTKPEVVFILLKTNLKDTYLIKDKNGSFYKRDAIWVAEFYLENKLVKEEYLVKF